MLKMGQMCHCKATIKKWNVDGTMIWRLRRGAPLAGTRADYAMHVDHSASLLYAGGSLVSAEDEGVLHKYSSIDTDPTVEWKSDRSGLTESALSSGALANRQKIAMGTDGYLTTLGNGTLQRYDPSNGDLLASASFSGLNTKIFPGPSGDVFIHAPSPVTSGTIRRLDPSLSETHSYDSGSFIGFGDVVDIDGSSLAFCQTNKIAVFSNSFTELRSLSASSTNLHRIVNNGSMAYVYSSSGPSFKKYDLSGISLTWTNATMQATGSGYMAPVPGPQNILMATDASHNLYCVMEKTAAVSKIQRRASSDGNIVWEVDVGTSKLENMRGLFVNETAGVLVAIGRWYHGAATTDPRHIIALDIDDGSELWTAQHGDPTLLASGFHDAAIDDDGYVYACGFDA